MKFSSTKAKGSKDRTLPGQFIYPVLLIGFLVLVGIVIGVDYLGLSAMTALHAQQQSLTNGQFVDVRLANQALTYSDHNARIIMRLAETSDEGEIQTLLDRRVDNSAKVSAVLRQLQSRIGSAEERQLFDAIVDTRGAYTGSYKQAIDSLLRQKDPERARQLLTFSTLPLLVKYHAAWSDYVRFQIEQMNSDLVESSNRYVAARQRTVHLMIFSVFLAWCIGALVIWRITAEVRSRESAEGDVRHLNEKLERKVQERTAALKKANDDLIVEIVERKQLEKTLRSETALFDAQLNSTLDGILVVDGDNRIILRNRQFVEMFRIPAQLLDSGDDNVVLAHVLQFVKNPEQFMRKVTYLYNHRDEICCDEIELTGGTVLERYSSPVIVEGGEYFGRIWTFRDITERKRNEAVVRRLSMAVEQSPVSVVITNLKGDITYVNQKFEQSTGYRREEVIGRNPRMLKSGHTGKEEYKKLWKAITSGKEWRGELQNRKKNGELYWESAVIRPIEDEKGETTHFLALKEDITEKRRIEVQLQQAQKLEAVGQLASGIAHEINTPTQYIGDNLSFLEEAFANLTKLLAAHDSLLAAARSNTISSEMLQELGSIADRVDVRYLLEESPKAFAQTKEGLGRVSKLVSAMKEFSHPGAKEKTPWDLNRAIDSTITISRNEWKYVADLTTDFDPNLPAIPCLVSEFNQVILNLIVNAAHAIGSTIKEGQATKGKIKVQTLNSPNWVEIRIEDTGTGIPKEIQPHVFEPFFTTKEVGKGTGQGLMIARSVIVDKHQGSIHFETEDGKGTTFIIRLPKDGKSLAPVGQGAHA